MEFPFSIITGKVIRNLIGSNCGGAIECVKQAYLAHEAGETVNPHGYFLRFPEKPGARIIALPAYLGGEVGVIAIAKWVYDAAVDADLARAEVVVSFLRKKQSSRCNQ